MRRWWATLHSPDGGIRERFDDVTDRQLWRRLEYMVRHGGIHPEATLRSGGKILLTGQQIAEECRAARR